MHIGTTTVVHVGIAWEFFRKIGSNPRCRNSREPVSCPLVAPKSFAKSHSSVGVKVQGSKLVVSRRFRKIGLDFCFALNPKTQHMSITLGPWKVKA